MLYKINKHILSHSDIMTLDLNEFYKNKPYILYSDPPWGSGNLKYWQTINNRMNKINYISTRNIHEFIDKIFRIIFYHVEFLSFIEYGIGWDDMIIEYINKYSLKLNSKIAIRYKSGNALKPHNLYIISKDEFDLGSNYIHSIENTFGYDTLKNALLPFVKRDKIITDPCCGLGYTARIAKETGMIFYGNELNKKRLDKTIRILQ